jgi:hypothetical protein
MKPIVLLTLTTLLLAPLTAIEAADVYLVKEGQPQAESINEPFMHHGIHCVAEREEMK